MAKGMLKIWNGRGWGNSKYDKDGNHIHSSTGADRCDHAYVCAHSRAEAVRLINKAAGYDAVTSNEIKIYWSKCWGRPMDGIEQEMGVWTTQGFADKPRRII